MICAAGRLVEISGRLIGHQDGGIGRQGPRQGNALLLAAGEFGRIVRGALAQPDRGQFPRGAFIGVGDAGDLQRHRDIFQRRHGRDEVERLEYDADIAAAKARQCVLVEPAEVFACDDDAAGVGPLKSGHHHQQGRFAGAGRADQADRLAAAYIEVDVFEDMNAGRRPRRATG